MKRGGLTDRERSLLDFERQWWKHKGSKEQAMLDLFGLAPVNYYQQLLALIDREDALAYAPDVVKRLQQKRPSSRRLVGARR